MRFYGLRAFGFYIEFWRCEILIADMGMIKWVLCFIKMDWPLGGRALHIIAVAAPGLRENSLRCR